MANSKLKAYLQLTRPANIITAVADIWAGFAVSGAATLILSQYAGNGNLYALPLIWLSLSTIGLYGGGVAFNDVFDAQLDAIERPERPIPSGKVKKSHAAWMAASLIALGVLAAFQVNIWSGLIALSVGLLAVLYDAWGKHQAIFGPINMGLCRAGNLLLGVSVIPELLPDFWALGLIPLAYVSAITMISRGEVHGKNKNALIGGLGIYITIIAVLLFIAFLEGNAGWKVIPFVGLFAYMILPPLVKALRLQQPQLIGKSVKAAVISLIILNASLAASFSGWWVGLCILILLPISLRLAKIFAVT
ncbi:UbiA-like protein EboC [Cecembia calidifontis]|jgi:4-hydroxybenzoate polyprenyltransferase|uniref:4-hydroxybenzoate polyprenyltransferase n=1 Tax=Cecembia calidifontis TaxID=1187080 RepID=A0A4Q7P8G1_9BACT|nr:UbiA-like protein EboC [Cecembia calidifontis]RZS96401.1 4-hydroxybenzoate polyprenyltransferase [Cecembia calidifontis]